jgi:hypothetical protein
MRKTLSYTSLILTALFVVALFFTAQTYTQLTAATLLYIPLAYFAFKSFQGTKSPSPNVGEGPKNKPEMVQEVKDENAESGNVVDIDKRAFLNLIGAAGLSIFLYSLFSRNGTGALFGKTTGSDTTKLQDSTGNTINPAERQPLDGYRISEIDDTNSQTYYGFTNIDGAWLIMKEDADTSSFRYVKGDSAFPDSWGSRDTLNYDYYFNVF